MSNIESAERRTVFSGQFVPPVGQELVTELPYPQGRPTGDQAVETLYTQGVEVTPDRAVDPLLADARARVAAAIDNTPPLPRGQL